MNSVLIEFQSDKGAGGDESLRCEEGEIVTKHATVRIGEYVLPLIGIPEDATQSKCEGCGKMTHIADLTLVGDKFLCERCQYEDEALR